MATTVSMPQLGETVTEGTILRWAKQVGDTIAEDEVLLEISTDKVDTEVPSPAAGTILEILVNEGDTVIVLEAMKMELPIKAPRSGVVKAVNCAKGELVQPGVNLLELE